VWRDRWLICLTKAIRRIRNSTNVVAVQFLVSLVLPAWITFLSHDKMCQSDVLLKCILPLMQAVSKSLIKVSVSAFRLCALSIYCQCSCFILFFSCLVGCRLSVPLYFTLWQSFCLSVCSSLCMSVFVSSSVCLAACQWSDIESSDSMERWRFGSVGNVVGRINEVNQPRARLVLGWVTVFKKGKLSLYVTSQPGHPSVGRQNEYWRWLRPSPGKKRRVLHNSRPCYQDCWHTDPVRYLADLSCMLA